jgi:hypothetical protein
MTRKKGGAHLTSFLSDMISASFCARAASGPAFSGLLLDDPEVAKLCLTSDNSASLDLSNASFLSNAACRTWHLDFRSDAQKQCLDSGC